MKKFSTKNLLITHQFIGFQMIVSKSLILFERINVSEIVWYDDGEQ